jgi:hypothetical protein
MAEGRQNALPAMTFFSGGTQLNWPAHPILGEASRANCRHKCVRSRAACDDPKSGRELHRSRHIDYWRCPSCKKSGRSAPADAGAGKSTRERARRISATGNRIPEVQQTSSARDRLGPHRIFEFGELSRVRRDQPAAREEYGIVHRAQPAPDTGARRIHADQDHRLLQ